MISKPWSIVKLSLIFAKGKVSVYGGIYTCGSNLTYALSGRRTFLTSAMITYIRVLSFVVLLFLAYQCTLMRYLDSRQELLLLIFNIRSNIKSGKSDNVQHLIFVSDF